MLDSFTLIRSVDARHSNHEPNKVFQTGNLDAAPRINRAGHLYPAIGSVVAKHHGAEPSRHAALRRLHEVAVAPRLRRLPRQAVRSRSSPTRPPACRSTTCRRGHRPDDATPTCFACRCGLTQRAHPRTPRACSRTFDRLRSDLDTSGVDGGDGPLRPAGGRMLAGRPMPRAPSI